MLCGRSLACSALLLLLAGCASHGTRDVWSAWTAPPSTERFRATHDACFNEAASAYVPFVAEMSGGYNIRRSVYKGCMEKAGYFRVRTEDVPLSEGRTCGSLNPLCKMELPVLSQP